MEMSVERRRHGTDKGEQEYWERNVFQYHFFHHKSLLDRWGIEPGLSRWDAVEYETNLEYM